MQCGLEGEVEARGKGKGKRRPGTLQSEKRDGKIAEWKTEKGEGEGEGNGAVPSGHSI